MAANITIEARGGEQQCFSCGADETLLSAGLRARIGMPYECSSGACGSCLFQLLDGEVDDLLPAARGINDEGKARGFRLACQSRARADCRIKLRLKEEYVPVHRPMNIAARLVQRTDLTVDMAEFTFKTKLPAHFLPGQYALLRVDRIETRRAYSMCKLPNDQALWSFIIKRIPGGATTSWLFNAALGEELTIEGPFGMAYLRTESPRNIVCVGGGSGLSPMLAIIRAAARCEAFDGRMIQFFYGGRCVADLCAARLIAAEPILAERVTLINAISGEAPEDAGWTGERGFIHAVVGRNLDPDPKVSDYYFCGPPQMTDAVHALLLHEHRVPAKQMYFDRFY